MTALTGTPVEKAITPFKVLTNVAVPLAAARWRPASCGRFAEHRLAFLSYHCVSDTTGAGHVSVGIPQGHRAAHTLHSIPSSEVRRHPQDA
jgi:hypothetical protein